METWVPILKKIWGLGVPKTGGPHFPVTPAPGNNTKSAGMARLVRELRMRGRKAFAWVGVFVGGPIGWLDSIKVT